MKELLNSNVFRMTKETHDRIAVWLDESKLNDYVFDENSYKKF